MLFNVSNNNKRLNYNWGVEYDNYAEGLYLSIDAPTIPISNSNASVIAPTPNILIDSISQANASSVSPVLQLGLPRPYSIVSIGG